MRELLLNFGSVGRLRVPRRRRHSGQSTVELCAGLLVLVPLVLVLFDLAVIVIGVQVNDQTCRQAARSASSGDPATAQQRAEAIIARANQQGSSMLSNFQLSQFTFNPGTVIADTNALRTSNGGYGGTVSGTVTVRTSVEIRPFVVPAVYSGGAPLVFVAEQTFPFTYLVPNES